MRPIRDLFSFKSPSFRKLGLDPESLTDRQMMSMVMGDPRLIRRPLGCDRRPDNRGQRSGCAQGGLRLGLSPTRVPRVG